jgi:hypothetical protein
MFGIEVWKWFAAAVGLTVVAMAGIPVISTVANLLSIVPCLVMVLVVFRFIGYFLAGFGGGSGGTEQHDAILRRAGRL